MGAGASAENRPVLMRTISSIDKASTSQQRSKRHRYVSLNTNTLSLSAIFGEESNRNNMIETARVKFNEFDRDKNGTLEKEELQGLVEWLLETHREFGINPADSETARITQKFCDSGRIDFDEFIDLFEEICVRVTVLNLARSKFNELDQDNDGFLADAELAAMTAWVLTSYEKQTTSEDEQKAILSEIMSKVDTNNDSKLDLFEFSLLFEHVTVKKSVMSRARPLFNELDVEKKGVLSAADLHLLAEKVLRYQYPVSSEAVVNANDKIGFVHRLMHRLEMSGSKEIDLDSFSTIYDGIEDQLNILAQARAQFDALDTTHRGILEADELILVTGK